MICITGVKLAIYFALEHICIVHNIPISSYLTGQALAVVDRAARIIWSPSLYRSCLGRAGTTCLAMNKRNSRQAFQQLRSSKVWIFMVSVVCYLLSVPRSPGGVTRSLFFVKGEVLSFKWLSV